MMRGWFGASIAQQHKRVQTTPSKAEALVPGAAGSAAGVAGSGNRAWTVQETVQSFPENSLLNTGYQFSSWHFTSCTEITELVTQNSAYSIVGESQKHPKGEKDKVLHKETRSRRPPSLDHVPLDSGGRCTPSRRARCV